MSLTAGGALTLAANVGGGTVNLVGPTITQSGGVIQAGTLTGTVQAAALTSANQVGRLGPFVANALALTDAQGLEVAGPVSVTGQPSSPRHRSIYRGG